MALKRVLLFVNLTCAIKSTHCDNGWRPLPVEIALFQTSSVPRSFSQPTFQRLIDTDDVTIIQRKSLDRNERDFDETKGASIPKTDDNRSLREGKDLNIKENLEKPTEGETLKIETKYEVTEKPESLDQLIAEEKNTYVYKVPKVQLTTPKENQPNSLTAKFLEILAKNNLNSEQNEVNYALSRSRNIRNRNILVTLPLRVPLGYNTQNHIPPDAILAMMLSNYGLYLPGMFGFSGKNKNLYGYLASNNIHNNKPFGLYKVFSDTDSSF